MYQPIVIHKGDEFIKILEEINFFSEQEIENTDFARKYFYDKLTEKFIDGTIEDGIIFYEDEMENILNEIIVGSTLYELKRKGYINSYSDDNIEETFFLTEDGKEYLRNIKDDELI